MASPRLLSKLNLVAASAGLFLFGSTLGVKAGPLSEPMINTDIAPSPGNELPFHAEFTGGYQSAYIFRGNNETPGAPGVGTEDLRISIKGFSVNDDITFDVFGVQQLGEGLYTVFYNYNHGESIKVQFNQRSYEKYIPSLQYTCSLGGFVEITLGDLFELETLTRGRFFPLKTGDSPAVSATSNTVFNKPYLAIAAPGAVSKLAPALDQFHLDPSINYYVTATATHALGKPTGIDVGYLSAKLQGGYDLVPGRLTLQPYGIIAYNLRDRAKISADGFNTNYFTGFQNFQTGLKLVTPITHYMDYTVEGFYVLDLGLAPTDQRNTFVGLTSVSFRF